MLGIINSCKQIQEQIALYLDNELQGQEKEEITQHLQKCDPCTLIYQQTRGLTDKVKQTKPLYSVPDKLRNSIETLLEASPTPYQTPVKLQHKVLAILEPKKINSFKFYSKKTLAALAATLIISLSSLIYLFYSPNSILDKPSDLALMGVDTHLRHQKEQLPLEITSSSTEEVSKWFANKLTFNLKLPNYQESSGQEKLYQLEGARLVGFKNDYAAYVSYKMQNRPITLVVTTSSVALPSGGEEIISKGITFHYSVINSLKVISWTDRGLTYALVSDLAERGQQSCIVCHSGTADKDFIDDLKFKL